MQSLEQPRAHVATMKMFCNLPQIQLRSYQATGLPVLIPVCIYVRIIKYIVQSVFKTRGDVTRQRLQTGSAKRPREADRQTDRAESPARTSSQHVLLSVIRVASLPVSPPNSKLSPPNNRQGKQNSAFLLFILAVIHSVLSNQLTQNVRFCRVSFWVIIVHWMMWRSLFTCNFSPTDMSENAFSSRKSTSFIWITPPAAIFPLFTHTSQFTEQNTGNRRYTWLAKGHVTSWPEVELWAKWN